MPQFYWYICTFTRRGLLVARRWGSDNISYFITQVTELYDDVIFCTDVDDSFLPSLLIRHLQQFPSFYIISRKIQKLPQKSPNFLKN